MSFTKPAPHRDAYHLDTSGSELSSYPAQCSKACTVVGGNTIWVEPTWWGSTSHEGRAFTLAHEIAHTEGFRSERDADTRAGAILNQWGYTLDVAMRGARGVVQSRDAASACRRGWTMQAGPK